MEFLRQALQLFHRRPEKADEKKVKAAVPLYIAFLKCESRAATTHP